MEKKIYGRVSANIPATLVNDKGREWHVTAVDTAGDGVSVLCDLDQRDEIAPGGNFLVGGRPVELSLNLRLPDEEGYETPFQVKCHIAFSRRLSSERCMIGMRYVNLESQNLSRLVSFLRKFAGFNQEYRPV